MAMPETVGLLLPAKDLENTYVLLSDISQDTSFNADKQMANNNSLRPSLSRRRKGKGSSIVLSSQRLHEIKIDESPFIKKKTDEATVCIDIDIRKSQSLIHDSDSTRPFENYIQVGDAKRKAVLQRLSIERANEVEIKLRQRRLAAVLIQRAWRSVQDRRAKKVVYVCKL